MACITQYDKEYTDSAAFGRFFDGKEEDHG